jgi:hypothetical protein
MVFDGNNDFATALDLSEVMPWVEKFTAMVRGHLS